MRKEYGKTLRSLFQKAMKTVAPDFLPTTVNSPYFAPGDLAFARRLDNGSSLWINLSPNKSGYEKFTVELGWSKAGRWPQLTTYPSPVRPENTKEYELEEYITRLAFLWGNRDLWFEIEPFGLSKTRQELMANLKQQMEPISTDLAILKVEPVIDECMEKLKQYGLPYLEAWSTNITQG